MAIVGILVPIVILIELAYYVLLIPDLSQKPLQVRPLDKHLGRIAYIIAYILSLLRAPLGLVPYLTKLFIFFVLRIRYESAQSTYMREVINMVGDIVNLGLTTVIIMVVVGPLPWCPITLPTTPTRGVATFLSLPPCTPLLSHPQETALYPILYLPLGAELVRIIMERVPVMFSAMWQLLPHRRVACMIGARQKSHPFWKSFARYLARYCRYYALSDLERMQYVLDALKCRAACDKDMLKRLEYISAFRIIPQRYGLRSGNVRDVARGEVFIHCVWTNDPWLLVGMAVRRAPWMFDPRYLRRPFYYMTEANLLATLCVLEHARYSPPYAVFQFGHEIRVARLHLFYGLLRWLGVDIEYKVQADGTFQFDQSIHWLMKQCGSAVPKQRDLYTDEEVIADVLHSHASDATITALDIAERYTYPLKYVEEVLWDKIEAARALCYLTF